METKRLKVKVCLVGEKAVGKTSLIRRYVLNLFDDHYITTIGTKVSKKEVEIVHATDRAVRVEMMIWDIMGHAGFRQLLGDAYFHGANGVLAVADLTRPATLDELGEWVSSVFDFVGPVPTVLAMNKADLVAPEHLGDETARAARAFGCPYLRTSAKTGVNIEEAFRRLALLVAERSLRPPQEGEAAVAH